ncbi:uncharacterized protein FA14DRAFT_183041 [Meira miltonrushii]|uniref:Uncharacterized protein n=1 Tax=Meira miltonrushii TaxID=1280837 RepID=A0A316VFS5_9BASI|nr:uncharacterized protein FA14DRAFT_183041 [Meira miltonrushii]PWN36469.1 hypothetical protein FA14DRAFT_183041 [Meira miltonrushii]
MLLEEAGCFSSFLRSIKDLDSQVGTVFTLTNLYNVRNFSILCEQCPKLVYVKRENAYLQWRALPRELEGTRWNEWEEIQNLSFSQSSYLASQIELIVIFVRLQSPSFIGHIKLIAIIMKANGSFATSEANAYRLSLSKNSTGSGKNSRGYELG